MIYIYCDFDNIIKIQQNEQRLVVRHTSEYVSLRQKLRRALDDEDHDLTVYIYSHLLAQWLADLRDYGEKVVRWKFIDARQQAQDHFGFPLPDEFDASAIQTLNLLSLQAPSYNVPDPEGWLLKQFLGTIWETREPDSVHLSKLVIWAASFTEQLHPALDQLAKKCLSQWSQKDERYSYFLQNERRQAANNVLLRWALRHYTEHFRERLGLSETPVIPFAENQEGYIELLQECKPTNELRRYWNLFFAGQTSFSSNLISIALNQMSGILEVELDALCSYLRQYSGTLSSSLLDRVQSHFHLLPMTKAALSKIEELIPPSLPTQPNTQWDTTRWLQWITEEYMPYFIWIVRTKQSRQTLLSLIDCFSDWLVREYPGFLFDQHPPLHLAYQHYICQLKRANPNVIVIWGIIDGLTWWQGKLLIDEFAQKQLHIYQLKPTLAALPSITTISKRALVRGYITPADAQRPIAKIAREQLALDFKDPSICNNPEDLIRAANAKNNFDIYVLLYNGLDAHNHESSTFTDDESVRGYLRAIASAIASAVSHIRRKGGEVRVVISSDHGSTLLPENAVRLDPPPFIQQFDDESEGEAGESKQGVVLRSRACKISHELDSEEILRLKENWYILNKDEFELVDTLLIPRGYAYAKRRPHGWVHGGATPEEVVVPFIEVSPFPLQVFTPEIVFDGYLLSNRSTTVPVTITNPNPFPLSGIHLSVINNEQAIFLSSLSATSSEKTNLTLSLETKGAQSIQLDWLLRCQVAGNDYEFTGKISLPVRRLQVSEVDELFGDIL